ncbi:hypothetical protein ACTA71_010235 [Dictyostelium dimigraforme]
MVPQQELVCSLELECSRKFGNSKYSFYYPIQLENFLITCWKTQTSTSTSSENLIVPQQSTSYTVTHKDYTINYNNNNNNNNNYNNINNKINNTTTGSDRYCCTIYEDGEIILPILDSRMKGFSWAKSFSKKSDFSKEELETLLSDIYQFCCFSR